MEKPLREAALSAFALLLLSGGLLCAQDSEVATIQKRVAYHEAAETETLQDILKLTAAIKASASPKDIAVDDVIKLEERLGFAVYVETRCFGSYNDPVGLVRRPVPADEKTVSKKIVDLLESAREDSQKAIKFYREKKYDPAMKEVKDVEKRLEGLQLQFDARSEVRAKRLEERAKAEEKAKASPKK